MVNLLNEVNLALAFARGGLRSGILDTDIFGPSIPTLLNLEGEQPRLSASKLSKSGRNRDRIQWLTRVREPTHPSFELWHQINVNGLSGRPGGTHSLERTHGYESGGATTP